MGSPSGSHERAAAVVEGMLVAFLTIVLALQLFGYPATDDPDPDGYVSYAHHLISTGKLLPDSPRLPGYPALLALVSKIGGEPLGLRIYWVQLVLYVAAALIAWRVVRHQLGPLAALILFGIIAAPSYLSRMSVVMLPDVPYALLWLPIFLGVAVWALADDPPGDWMMLNPLALGLFALQAMNPATTTLAILFVPCLIVAIFLTRGPEREYGVRFRWGVGAALSRVGAFLAVVLLVAVGSDRLLDTGAREHSFDRLAYRAVVALPPAENTPADERIEAAKGRFREAEGEPIEQARFGAYRSFALTDEMAREDVEAIWKGRVLAHPLQYLGSIVNDLRLTQYLAARQLVPFFANVEPRPLFAEPFPPDDGSPASTMFRRTGLLVSDQPATADSASLGTETARALLRMVVTWGLLALGVWQLGRLAPVVTIAIGLLGVLYVLTLAATSTVDIRELLPFVPLVYIAQAVGLTWIVEAIVARHRVL
jgi:hypothetical protein